MSRLRGARLGGTVRTREHHMHRDNTSSSTHLVYKIGGHGHKVQSSKFIFIYQLHHIRMVSDLTILK